MKLVSNKYDFQDPHRHVSRLGKKIEMEMRLNDFSDRDLIAVMSFLAELKDACSLNCVPESVGAWCF